MKEKILKVAKDLERGLISEANAQRLLLDLFRFPRKPPPRPRPGDYFESETEGNRPSTRARGLTWKQEYERDLSRWQSKYDRKSFIDVTVIKIRFNTEHDGGEYCWRALIGGVEHLVKNVSISVPCSTTKDFLEDKGQYKWHISCISSNYYISDGVLFVN